MFFAIEPARHRIKEIEGSPSTRRYSPMKVRLRLERNSAPIWDWVSVTQGPLLSLPIFGGFSFDHASLTDQVNPYLKINGVDRTMPATIIVMFRLDPSICSQSASITLRVLPSRYYPEWPRRFLSPSTRQVRTPALRYP